MSLDINLLDCYGMSESSGILTLNTSGSHSLGSVGQGLPGIKLKIVDPNERGEKLRKSRDFFCQRPLNKPVAWL